MNTPSPLRHIMITAGLTFGLFAPAFADDLCAAPAANISQLVSDLTRSVGSAKGSGTFKVKKTNIETAPDAYVAEYVIGSKTAFTARFLQQTSVSDQLAVAVPPKSPGSLLVTYGFGAASAVSCQFAVSRVGGAFRATKRTSG